MRIGVLWRAEWDPVVEGRRLVENSRLHRVFEALSDLDVEAEPVVYADDAVERVRHQLLGLDGVLVWVNPIERGLDRSRLDPLLRDVAAAGVWISAHPDVILRMGTKEVLYRTRNMSWGTDTHLYRTFEELRQQLPGRLAHGLPRVLKQYRGMGGDGVWKVAVDEPCSSPVLDLDGVVRVQHARRDSVEERVHFGEFIDRCEQYFVGPGRMIDQPFQERLPEGMIRVYLTHDKVVGFAHQHPHGLLPPLADSDRPGPAPPPTTRFEGASAPAFQHLKARMETEWAPTLKHLLEIETTSLPVIWDTDLLYGPRTPTGEDTYVLCEINVSSTFAFPEQALQTVAQAAVARVRASKLARREP